MYYTPGWAMLVTATVGVVGVCGTLAAAWITQHHTNRRFRQEREEQTSRFLTERRDGHYDSQRETVAEVVGLSTRVTANALRVAGAAGGEITGQHVQLLNTYVDSLTSDSIEMPLVIARARLIISDTTVLDRLSDIERALWTTVRAASIVGGRVDQPEQSDIEALRESANLLRTGTNELVSVTRQRLWET